MTLDITSNTFASTSTSAAAASTEPADILSTADLLTAASTHFASKQYTLSADTYSTVLSMLVNEHGPLSPQCAQAYLLYGEALFMDAYSKTGLFDSTAVEVNEGAIGAEGNGMVFLSDDEDDEDDQDEQPAVATNEDANNPDADADAEQEEDEDDFAIAWQVLETSRLIYSSIPNSGLHLSKIYSLLGDISLETENWAQASADYLQAGQLLKELDPMGRSLAEIYYKQGIALEQVSDQANCKLAYKNAFDTLSSRLKWLTSIHHCESNGDKGKEKMAATDPNEIGDLQELLGDISAKLEDLSADNAMVCVGESSKGGVSSTKSPAQSDANAVTDLTGLVKRKGEHKDQVEIKIQKVNE